MRDYLTATYPNLYLITDPINPYSLLDICDEIWVATSGLGFEGLLNKRKVRCFGAPFYSGWGLTTDQIEVPYRYRERSLNDIFHASYIMLARYFHPIKQKSCTLEEILLYIAKTGLGCI